MGWLIIFGVFAFSLLFVLLLVFLLGVQTGRKSLYASAYATPRSLWNRGESMVMWSLAKSFNTNEFHLLNNVTIPFQDGTTQIDHVLLSTKGIFVIETKHFSGWLFANENSAEWTQVLYRVKHRFRNPIRQNFKHLKAIQEMLDFIPKEHIHSLVVFTGSAEFKTEIPAGVVQLPALFEKISSYQENVITPNRVQFCVGRIECVRYQISQQTDLDHQTYLSRKFTRTS